MDVLHEGSSVVEGEMIKVGGKVHGVAETNSAMNQIPGLLQQAGIGAMTEALELVSETLRKDYLEGPYPEEIQSRSGSFRATFRRGHKDNIFRVEARGTQILGTFGSQDKRGHILNDGGVVRSSRPGGLLAVRTDFTKTSGGVVREKYRGSLRNVPNTFVRMGSAKGGRQGRGTVFEKIGKRIIPIAWLVLYVLIKGRHFAEKTVAKAGPMIPPIFERKFQTVVTRFQETLNRVRR